MNGFNRACVEAIALCLTLSACGGAGGGVNSTPAPSPAPSPAPTPTPTNSDVANLKVSQTFAVQSAHSDPIFDLTAGTTTISSASQAPLTIAYDASTGGYTVSGSGRTVAFTSADKQTSSFPGETDFAQQTGGNHEYLTLTNVGYGSNLTTHSVGLGYWQSNSVTGSTQATVFDVFVYGFPSPASAVPRTGSAYFTTDLFGFATPVGKEPLVIEGAGTTTFDFAHGNFILDTNVGEYYLVSGNYLTAPAFRAAGDIGSSGDFMGTFSFEHPGDTMNGTFNGSFFGPNAGEAGGTFFGTGLPGSSISGAFTAQSGAAAQSNTTLASLSPNSILYGSDSWLHTLHYVDPATPGQALTYGPSGAAVNYKFDADDYAVEGFPDHFPSSDLITSNGEFDVYENTALDGTGYSFSRFKPSGNGQIELTYSTFAEFDVKYLTDAMVNVDDRHFMSLGLVTPHGTLAARTGSATYHGIAYGAAASVDGARSLSVSGTSQFDVNFSDQSLGGWLQLSGKDRADGSTVDFGRFDLYPSKGFDFERVSTGFTNNALPGSAIQLYFYGPAADELGGSFSILPTNGYRIAGATVTTRH